MASRFKQTKQPQTRLDDKNVIYINVLPARPARPSGSTDCEAEAKRSPLFHPSNPSAFHPPPSKPSIHPPKPSIHVPKPSKPPIHPPPKSSVHPPPPIHVPKPPIHPPQSPKPMSAPMVDIPLNTPSFHQTTPNKPGCYPPPHTKTIGGKTYTVEWDAIHGGYPLFPDEEANHKEQVYSLLVGALLPLLLLITVGLGLFIILDGGWVSYMLFGVSLFLVVVGGCLALWHRQTANKSFGNFENPMPFGGWYCGRSIYSSSPTTTLSKKAPERDGPTGDIESQPSHSRC